MFPPVALDLHVLGIAANLDKAAQMEQEAGHVKETENSQAAGGLA